MKGKHFVSVSKKNNWLTVYINSEIINAKEPVAKFINKEEAWDWAYGHSEGLGIGIKEEESG